MIEKFFKKKESKDGLTKDYTDSLPSNDQDLNQKLDQDLSTANEKPNNEHILNSIESLTTKAKEALGKVVDPEIGIDIVNLGLIYKIDIDEQGHAEIDMTLTSMGCPIGPQFQAMAKSAVESISGIHSATVNIVFSPPWDPRKMASEDAKIMLGIF